MSRITQDQPTRYSAKANPLSHAITLGLFMMGCSVANAQSDSNDVEEIVVTASGISQRLVDAPASISVVSAVELQKRPYITLTDAVRELEGVDVGETSDKTGQRTISMRGMGADYTLLLIDGKRQNNHGDIYPNNFGGNQFNHVPPLDSIERIEVIRGPASTLYGADALGGVINIITKKSAQTWTGSFTAGHSFQENSAFGTDSTYDLSLFGPILRDTLTLALRGSWYERDASQPEYELITDPAGVQHERALGFGRGGKTVDNTNKSAGFTLNWNLSEDQRLAFDYDLSQQKYDNTPFTNNLGTLSYPLGTVDNISSIWQVRSGRVNPRAGYAADQQFDRDQWSVTWEADWGVTRSLVSLAHIDTVNEGRTLPLTVAERLDLQDMWDAVGPYAGMSEEERRNLAEATFLPRPDRHLASSQYTLDARMEIPVQGFAGEHIFVVGGQVIDGELDDGVFGMEAGNDGAGVVQDHEMFSLYIEDNWTPVDPLTFTFGLRHDDHEVFGTHLSPRAYAVYTISDSWTVKGGVSTGFKTPKTTDLYDGVTGFGGQGTSPFVGNPDLQPETSVNKEIAVYWNSLNGGHNFNVTYFLNDFEDKIDRGETSLSCEQTGGVRPCANLGAYGQLNYTSYSQRVNIDEAEIQGVEIAGRYQILEQLSLRANYTWTDSEQLTGADAGLPLTNTAENMLNSTLDWFVNDDLSLQLTLESRSDRYRGTDANGNKQYYKPYDVLHLGGQYHFNEALTLSVRVNNLLDEDFTSFQTLFIEESPGVFEPDFIDNYNNKDKARNYWVSLNYNF
ncbi:MAG: TonB-dependent receptor [Pseudomonadales bacterium]|nr:TonB-dependent receptor [Pseudomonadales bacterium]